ncbi:MAG: AAA family ATPase [Pseudomonadota bacterium]
MLKKIDLLENIGRFVRLQHRAEPYGQLALIFAGNGYGKSTACAVLRSANAQDPTPIAERLHLGGGNASATLQTDECGTVAFTGGSWNKAPPAILVFDSEFVRRNVHAAEEVTRDNKRGLFQIILGASGVTLAQKIEELAEENATLNGKLRDLERAIKRAAPAATDVTTFIAAKLPDNLVERTQSAAGIVRRVDRAVEVSRRPLLATIDLGCSPSETSAILQQAGEQEADDNQAIIQAHLEKHMMGDQGSGWLRFGLTHIVDEDCPFCDQSLEGSRVIAPMRSIFSDEFKAIIDRCEKEAEGLSGLIAEAGPSSVEAVLAANADLLRFWSSFCSTEELPDFDEEAISEMRRIIAQIHAAFRTKAGNPAAVVDIGDDQLSVWDTVQLRIAAYNEAVQSANEQIGKIKADEGRPSEQEIAEAKTRLSKFEALGKREVEPLKSLCEDFTNCMQRREEIARERRAVQDALREHTKAMAVEYQEGVNALLEQFGTNFRLCQTEPTFKGGGIPNTEYCIDVDGYVLAAGESKGGPEPSFRTVLSAGDKASLALALFINQAKKRADLAETIIVFDDPFSSQDAGRQFETSARIRELSELACQVVVFSHDARFLNMIQRDATECSEHQIVFPSDWHGTVSAWSAETEVQQAYVRKAQRIRSYAATGACLSDTTVDALASDLRVFLEEFLDLRFPGRFVRGDNLGAMARSIQDAGMADPLFKHATALRELNEYSRPEHHRGSGQVNPNQLRAQCRKVVAILGDY